MHNPEKVENSNVAELPVQSAPTQINFETSPENYHHWNLSFNGPIAELQMDVSETDTMFPGYELKLNSYDIGVDIELYDAIQRLRFEHPEVKTVVMTSSKASMFCAGANIRMLGGAAHGHKVNFCKFTNETRNSIEDAADYSGQRYLAALNGTAAGGGYELALAADHILLIDDGNAAVSLPEVPLLAVLPGTGGLTRVVDKRKVRRDHSDIFSTVEEGIKGQRAVDWRLVDEIAPSSTFNEKVQERAAEMASRSDRPDDAEGVKFTALNRKLTDNDISYSYVAVSIDRELNTATLTVNGPDSAVPTSLDNALAQGDAFWPLNLVRELDDALLHMRFNEPEIGTIVIKTAGDGNAVKQYDSFLYTHKDHWLMREIVLYWKRTLKRLDLTSRTLFAFVEPGSCFVGFLAEILFAVDRSYMLDGQFEGNDLPAAVIELTNFNFEQLPMSNGITRLETRFLGEPESVDKAKALIGQQLDAQQCLEAGLITYAPDDIDWDDEVRLLIEERASFSPDALTGMEANLRFAGPETMETKIFGRLTAWQNWIFQRPNAVSDNGALKLYGTGKRPQYDQKRV